MDTTPAPEGRVSARSVDRFQGPSPILVGRTEEQAALRDYLAAAAAGNGQVCLLGGEAGIGKTTLARDLAHSAGGRGIRVIGGSSHDLTSAPPYGPWLDLFEACRRDPAIPAPPAAFAGGQLAAITDQAALLADVRRFFAELVADRPALVILEDLHWADPASLDLVRRIGPHVRHWPMLLLVTYRSDELAPGHPLSGHLPALVREADGRRLDLHRLEPDALRTLIASQYRLSGPDEDRLLAYLARHAEGNPFFATEILRALDEDGVFQAGDGVLLLAALDRAVVPTLLRQVIDGRVVRLGEETRKALAIAAVIGQEVPLALWGQVAGSDEATIVDIVERSVEAHLLEAEQDGTRVRFMHALTREALYQGILPPRRRIWHRIIAEALMAAARPDPDAVAFHLRQAADPRAAEWLVMAGERAQRAYAWLTAAERFRAAVALLDGIEGQASLRRRLLVRVFYLLRFAYPAGALSAMDEALRLSIEAGDTYVVAETRSLRGLLLCYIDHFRNGLAEMELGIGAIEALPPIAQQSFNTMRDWLNLAFTGSREGVPADDQAAIEQLMAARVDFRRSYHAWMLAAAGRTREAQAIRDRLGEILEGGAGGGIRLAGAFARHAVAIAAAADGRPADSAAAWAQARRDFGDHHVLVAFTFLDDIRDVALTCRANDPDLRRRLATEAAAALGRAVGALRPGVSPALAWLRCLVADGRWEEALRILAELPPPGSPFLRRETTWATSFLARHRGEPDLAWTAIRPFFPQGPATVPGDLVHQEALDLMRLAAGLCIDADDLAGARAWLAAHDRWLDWSGSVLGRAAGLLAWGEFHHAAGAIELAQSALNDALAAEPKQHLVRLGAHRLLGEIATGAGRAGDAESHLALALALADACDMPFERALTQVALARLRAQSSPDEATRLAGDARRTLVALGAAPALARLDALTLHPGAALSNRFGLTARELDVLRLVAEGQTNPEIAETLFISLRTAATHVSNIYRKLDVGSRAEAVDQAHRYALLQPR